MHVKAMEKSYVITKETTDWESMSTDTVVLSVALDRDVAVELVDKYSQSFETRNPRFKGKGEEHGDRDGEPVWSTFGISYDDDKLNRLIDIMLTPKPTFDKSL